MEVKTCLQTVAVCLGVMTVLLSLNSCYSTGRADKEAADLYLGTPSERTPYDGKYEKVRKYLHEAFTTIRYVPEPDGQDYWQLPQETESLGTGDCEDFAIWLYAKLRHDGTDNLRMCIGKHTQASSTMHAWLLWFNRGQVYILDPSVTGDMLNARSVSARMYIPYYSYDGEKKWVHRRQGK